MMSSYSILTRRVLGIDVNVWLTMLGSILLSVILLGYNLITYDDALNAEITIVDIGGSTKNSLYAKEIITFTTNIKGKVKWDFGDSLQQEGTAVTHKYITPGKRQISLYLDGRVVKTDSIFINENEPLVQPDPTDEKPIWGPDYITTGRKVTFVYVGKTKPKSFSWTIENDPTYPMQTANRASFVFLTEGQVNVQLKLDNNPAKIYTMAVTVGAGRSARLAPAAGSSGRGGSKQSEDGGFKGFVEQRPITADSTPAASKTVVETPTVANTEAAQNHVVKKYTTDDYFKKLLTGVTAGERTVKDFNDYLCAGGNTTVVANGQERTLESLCEVLYKSKYVVETVVVSRDFQKCVTRLSVKYRKKLFPF